MAGRADLDLHNAFYDLFIDRSRWPALIREGYERAARALDAFRPRRRTAHPSTNGARTNMTPRRQL